MNQILVVEVEPDMVVTYERALRRAGHRVVTAVSCAEGNRLLESVRAPDSRTETAWRSSERRRSSTPPLP